MLITVGAVVGLYVGLNLWQVPVGHINGQYQLSQSAFAGPLESVLAINSSTGQGNMAVSLNDFKYSSPDNSTFISASSASAQITLTPEGNESRVDLNVQFSGVYVKSPSFTGSFGSASLSGYVLVNPKTNTLVVSLVESTSAADIIKSILGV